MTRKSNTLLTYLFSICLVYTYGGWKILPVDTARILAVETFGGRSHWNYVSSILRVLSNNGHHVTVFTPIPEGERDNYTEVDTSNDLQIFQEMNLTDLLRSFRFPISVMESTRTNRVSMCDPVYKSVELNKIMEEKENSNFDVLVIETLGYDCELYLASKLNLPLIYLVSTPVIFEERFISGDIPNPATISHLYANHDIPKTFVQRFLNTALLAYGMILFSYDKWIRQYAMNRPYDLDTSTVRPSSLTFLNSHFISEASRPFPQNVIQVGGIHLKPPKSIPNDILEFIENSPHGVILFSLGSVVNMSTTPDYIINPLKEALAQVPQRILWKYEGEMANKPKNIMIRKWFPQRDILLHPNVKLFISHGGISGVHETVDAGVPVLGFPLFCDQLRNIDNLVNAGMATSMDILSVKKDTFLRNVLELVNDEKFMRHAKIASDIFKNRPMSPEQSILYWTEYVIRHKGAPHLASHSLSLTWYQYLLLDVIAATTVFICASLFITYNLIKMFHKHIWKNMLYTKAKSE